MYGLVLFYLIYTIVCLIFYFILIFLMVSVHVPVRLSLSLSVALLGFSVVWPVGMVTLHLSGVYLGEFKYAQVWRESIMHVCAKDSTVYLLKTLALNR